MLPLAPLIASILTLDFSVLGAAAAVGNTDGSSSFLEKPSPNNIGESSALTVEEDWGFRRLNAFAFGELDETPDDAADDELQGGLESRRLAASHSSGQQVQVENDVRVKEVSEEKKANEEDPVELERRRVLRTMPKLPPYKGVNFFLAAVIVMLVGTCILEFGKASLERNRRSDNRKFSEALVYIGFGMSWIGVALSLGTLVRVVHSGYLRDKWAKQAQQAIMEFQGELQDLE
ncbi:hypothetical protein Emed_007172 [Eimeria media]